MLIRLGYDIRFDLRRRCRWCCCSQVHPSRRHDLREPDRLRVEPEIPSRNTTTSSATSATRFLAPAGSAAPATTRRSSRTRGQPDPVTPDAREVPGRAICRPKRPALPHDQPVLRGRPAVADRARAVRRRTAPGWARVQAICDWVHTTCRFSATPHARPTRTALDVFTERVGVCRDFQHLAIASAAA